MASVEMIEEEAATGKVKEILIEQIRAEGALVGSARRARRRNRRPLTLIHERASDLAYEARTTEGCEVSDNCLGGKH